jgi:hypothetical protein
MIGQIFLATLMVLADQAEAGTIGCRNWQSGDVELQEIHQILLELALPGSDRVVHPESAAPTVNQSGFAKVSQMARHGGLRKFDCGNDIADTEFLLGEEQSQYPKAGFIGEGFEYAGW